ncbi:MAG: hypothetical protein JWM86_2003 [Thermoleophilia bacterium]|nr:hypothetical protein [Thermoleophilia bacterium]
MRLPTLIDAWSGPAPLLRSRDATSNEGAFTLIELVVAMVLLAMVLAMASGSIVRQFGGARTARSGAASDAAIARATNQFSDDVAGAMTPDLRDGKLRDPVEYRAAVQRNETATSSDPSQPGRALDIDVVVTARGDQLSLRRDVHRSAGVECVTWRVNPGAAYRVERMVDPAGACGRGSLGRTTMVSAPSGIAGLDRTPFAYQLICKGCPNGGRPTCRSWSAPAATTAQRRWVVAAAMSVTDIGGDASTLARGSSRVGIRLRDTESYRRALGC